MQDCSAWWWCIHGSHTPHLCHVALSCKLLQQEEEEIASRALSGCGWLDVRLVSERERLAASAWPAGQQNRLTVVRPARLASASWLAAAPHPFPFGIAWPWPPAACAREKKSCRHGSTYVVDADPTILQQAWTNKLRVSVCVQRYDDACGWDRWLLGWRVCCCCSQLLDRSVVFITGTVIFWGGGSTVEI
jgi:hypothetical protein